MTDATEGDSNRSPEPFSEEVRLGLVLYGGVSLAIYIYGVVRELHDAVRGKRLYSTLKDLLAADIVIDVASGTSAGGINALLLGRALATGADLGSIAELWREKGDLGLLLEDPLGSAFEAGGSKPDATGDIPLAMFRSEAAFRQELIKAFAKLGPTHGVKPKPRERPSEVHEFDAFVTGTDLNGRIYAERDSRGSEISVKNHRAAFHLKHRAQAGDGPRKSAFLGSARSGLSEAEICEGLGSIARVTSAFPVAFHPVCYSPEGARQEGTYHRLMAATLRGRGYATRGAPRSSATPSEIWFTDGGVLDNKPFSQTLRTIFHRAADRRVTRKLFYVEPDPERWSPKATDKGTPPPEQVAIAAIVGIPSYESIEEDLAEIRDHNRRLATLDHLRKAAAAEDPGVSATTSKLYVASRGLSVINRFIWAACTRGDDSKLTERLLARVREYVARQLNEQEATWLLAPLDTDFAMRRIFHVIYTVYNEAFATPTGANDSDAARERREQASKLLRVLFGQVERLEVAAVAIEDLVITVLADADQFGSPEQLVKTLYERVGSALAEVSPEGPVDQLHATLADKVGVARAIRREPREATPAGSPRAESLLDRIADQTRGLLIRWAETAPVDLARTARSAYRDFEKIDVQIFPIQEASGLVGRDHIDLVRVSPYDTRSAGGYGQEWGLSPTEKISGDSFHHFGGFLARSWRSNDIFWGRVDGLEILVDSLLDEERIGALVSSPTGSERLAAALKDLGEWLEDDELNNLRDRIARCTTEDGSAEIPALRQDLVDAFVRAGSRAIALEDVPGIARDRAVDEGGGTETTATRRVSEQVAQRLADLRARRSWDDFDKAVKHHLERLGQQTLADVFEERTVPLATTATQAAYLMAKMLSLRSRAGSNSPAAVRALNTALARLGRVLQIPLAPLHIIARALGTGRIAGAMLLTMAFSAFVTAIVLVVVWHPQSGVPGTWWSVLAVLGAAVFLLNLGVRRLLAKS